MTEDTMLYVARITEPFILALVILCVVAVPLLALWLFVRALTPELPKDRL